jgi:hypothetical protein
MESIHPQRTKRKERGVNMGYVMDTAMSKFIPPFGLPGMTAGTWTPTVASNLVSNLRTAADASNTILIPIHMPGNEVALKGAQLKSIDVWYRVSTAALDDFATVELEKVTLPATTVAPTGAAVTVSIDTGHDTAAERLAAAYHKMTITLTTPEWLDDDSAYYLNLVIDAAATSVFTFYGCMVHYTFRA